MFGTIRIPPHGEAAGPLVRQHLSLPERFTSWTEYRARWSAALEELISLALREEVDKYRALVLASLSQRTGKKCPHGPLKMFTVSKPGPHQNRPFFSCRTPPCNVFEWADTDATRESSAASVAKAREDPSLGSWSPDQIQSLQASLRRGGSPAYLNCSLPPPAGAGSSWRGGYGGGGGGGGWYRKRGGGGAGGDGRDREGRSAPSFSSGRFRLELGNTEVSTVYAKEDVWIISSTLLLEKRTQGDVLCVAKSLFHGPRSGGHLDLEVLVCQGSFSPSSHGRLFALRGPNMSSEIKELLSLDQVQPASFPLLPAVLQSREPRELLVARAAGPGSGPPRMFSAALPEEAIAAGTDVAEGLLSLNEDQRRLLGAVLRWDPASPVLLLRGSFGSGKSSTLVAILLSLVAAYEAAGRLDDCRILVCCATNHAVDRVLTELSARGFTKFIRVGSMRRMAKSILPLAVGNLAVEEGDVSGSTSEALKELQATLREAQGPRERAQVLAAIAEVKNGMMHARAKRLQSVPIVGVTTAATDFPVLQGSSFSLVIIDECTQMTEPASVQAITRFCAERVILAGDPRQLPPVVGFEPEPGAAPAGGALGGGAPAGVGVGLSRTLFDRLERCGQEPIDLRWQYRCHPHISRIANEAFYGSSLIDGITAGQRAPLLPGLPAAWVLDVEYGAEESQGASMRNTAEARAIAALLLKLKAGGIPPGKIGVICVYKAQVQAIKDAIEQSDPEAAVMLGKRRRTASKPKNNTKKALAARPAAAPVPVGACDAGSEDGGSDEDGEGEGEVGDAEAALEGAEDSLAGPPPAAAPEEPEAPGIYEVSTVDAFQGREKEVIIVSSVRTTASGFTDNAKRVNVALTRAKRHFVLAGAVPVLEQGAVWGEVVRGIKRVAEAERFPWKIPYSELDCCDQDNFLKLFEYFPK